MTHADAPSDKSNEVLQEMRWRNKTLVSYKANHSYGLSLISGAPFKVVKLLSGLSAPVVLEDEMLFNKMMPVPKNANPYEYEDRATAFYHDNQHLMEVRIWKAKYNDGKKERVRTISQLVKLATRG